MKGLYILKGRKLKEARPVWTGSRLEPWTKHEMSIKFLILNVKRKM